MAGTIMSVSGPSGVGKSTVCRRLTEKLDAFLSVSVTTRPQRPGEVDGQDYWFISREDFERRIATDEVIEYAEVYGGHYYGTPAGPVNEALDADRLVILEIEIEGTIQVQRRYPDLIGVYLLAPSPDDQRHRLVGRQQDSQQAIAERLSKADGEIRYAKDCGAYQHFVVNNEIEETVQTLVRIVQERQSG